MYVCMFSARVVSGYAGVGHCKTCESLYRSAKDLVSEFVCACVRLFLQFCQISSEWSVHVHTARRV